MKSSASSTPGSWLASTASNTSLRRCARPDVTPTASLSQISAAQSAAKASASQPPVRCNVVTYSTFILAGIWPQIFIAVRFAFGPADVLVVGIGNGASVRTPGVILAWYGGETLTK